jgi:hypothetical protein
MESIITTISGTELACGVRPLLIPNTECHCHAAFHLGLSNQFNQISFNGQKQAFIFVMYLKKNKAQNSRGKMTVQVV